MDTYSVLREFADSWFLVVMFVFFIAACLMPFRPSRRLANEEAASIPFRNETLETGCSGNCETCKAKDIEVL